MSWFSGGQKVERDVSLPHGSIRWPLLIEIAFKNLFYKKLRTTLTIMGVIIGVGAVVFLLAFGFGLRGVVTNQVVDSNTIRAIDVESAKSQLVQLNQKTTDNISQLQHVTSAIKIYSVAGTTDYQNSNIESVVYAVDVPYFKITNFSLAEGKAPAFNETGDIYINTSYAKAIGVDNYKDLVGKPITLQYPLPENVIKERSKAGIKEKEAELNGTVAGVFETGSGAEVYISSKVFEDIGFQSASQLKVLVDEKENVADVQKQIEALGLVTNSPLSTLEQINQVFAFLNLLFLGFGGIGLIIAILGMFNTLTISLLERTKEIGLMMTLGARKKDIRRLFMVEAVGLSLIGGLLGAFTAFILSRITDFILNKFAQGRGVSESFSIFSFHLELLALVFAFSALLGLAVVYFPAKRAANTNPIDALRS